MAEIEEINTLHENKTVRLKLKDAINNAVEQLQMLIGLELSSVVGASRTEDGWNITIEFIERKAIPDTLDVLGIYEVELDEDGDVINYERRSMRKRMDLEEIVE
ncbi:hypothetical protein GF312_08890 [Candidatus Poribacteria bacterium]|nr:hypothetical protein [Candidatus Poribacteria bacterium]